MLFQFFTIGRFYFGFILCVTFVTRWSCFLTVSVELYELMNFGGTISLLNQSFNPRTLAPTSACLSVRLSNACFVTKRKKDLSLFALPLTTPVTVLFSYTSCPLKRTIPGCRRKLLPSYNQGLARFYVVAIFTGV